MPQKRILIYLEYTYCIYWKYALGYVTYRMYKSYRIGLIMCLFRKDFILSRAGLFNTVEDRR